MRAHRSPAGRRLVGLGAAAGLSLLALLLGRPAGAQATTMPGAPADGPCDSAAVRGRQALDAKDAARAQRELEEAVGRCPRSAEHRLWLGRAMILRARDASLLRKGGLATRAREEWEAVVRLDTADVEARWELGAWYLGAPRFAGGSAAKAMALAEEIRQRDPARGALAAAHVHAHEGRATEAEREARTALALDPGNARALALLKRLKVEP